MKNCGQIALHLLKNLLWHRIVAGITDLFVGTDYESLISQIVDIVLSSDKPKILYLTSLKSFGKKDGTEVYRKIKNSAISV